jgi:hypothetical protein
VEIERFADRSDRGTIFEDLRVLDLRTRSDLARSGGPDEAGWRRIVAAIDRPKRRTVSGRLDRRFKEWAETNDFKMWPLREFVERVLIIEAEGDCYAVDFEWNRDDFRPATIDEDGVFFLNWPCIPLYLPGGFEGFAANVARLTRLVAELEHAPAACESSPGQTLAGTDLRT